MAFVTVYDIDGNPHEKEPVDARECVEEMGWSMEPVGGKDPLKDLPLVESQSETYQYVNAVDNPAKRGRKSKGNEAE